MKNIVGAPARKESFYPRDRELQKIISKIADGNNLQIAAPRRVGKTSILFSLLDNKVDNHIYVYVDTEAIYDSELFYKKILKEILKTDEIANSSILKKLFDHGDKFLRKIKSIKVAGAGLDFNEEEKVSYKEELENLLCGIQLENNRKLVLLIDEFPQTIQNISEKVGDGVKEAIAFLQSNRDLRLNSDINGKVIFIYTGSIGLNHTVSAINGTAFINDINSTEVGPLKHEEAKELLAFLLSAKGINISDDVADYLLAKIEWLIPFHIQLAVQELLSLNDLVSGISIEIIDKSFENITASRNNNHFEHYYSRLGKSFKDKDYAFAVNLLNEIAENIIIDKGRAYDIAVHHGVQNKFRNNIEILMYDGYINDNSDTSKYRFNSPILRMWWQRYIN